ncbi:MAG: hypothetical protein M0Q37_07740 [Sphaerochaeta sp.]|nr:hypothetical protein [Sphaerochaeta sp.]
MSKKSPLVLLIMLAILTPAFGAIDKVSVGGTYAMETITRGESTVEEKITSAGVVVNGSSYFSPLNDIGMKYWLGVRKSLTWTEGNTTLDVTDVPWYMDAGVAVAYQAPVNLDLFLEAGAGFQYSLQSASEFGITVELGTFYLNAFFELNYALQSNLFLSAGVLAGYPLYIDGSIKVGSYTWSGNESAKGIYIAPYAAISFAY